MFALLALAQCPLVRILVLTLPSLVRLALQFTIVSAIGIVWECAVFCYFGSMAENVTSIASGGGMSGPFEWVMLGVSVVMCIVGAVFVSFRIK